MVIAVGQQDRTSVTRQSGIGWRHILAGWLGMTAGVAAAAPLGNHTVTSGQPFNLSWSGTITAAYRFTAPGFVSVDHVVGRPVGTFGQPSAYGDQNVDVVSGLLFHVSRDANFYELGDQPVLLRTWGGSSAFRGGFGHGNRFAINNNAGVEIFDSSGNVASSSIGPDNVARIVLNDGVSMFSTLTNGTHAFGVTFNVQGPTSQFVAAVAVSAGLSFTNGVSVAAQDGSNLYLCMSNGIQRLSGVPSVLMAGNAFGIACSVVAAENGLVYAVAIAGGGPLGQFRVYNASSGSELGSIVPTCGAGTATAVDKNGPFVVVAYPGCVLMINVLDPTNPQIMGSSGAVDPLDVAIDTGRVYVAQRGGTGLVLRFNQAEFSGVAGASGGYQIVIEANNGTGWVVVEVAQLTVASPGSTGVGSSGSTASLSTATSSTGVSSSGSTISPSTVIAGGQASSTSNIFGIWFILGTAGGSVVCVSIGGYILVRKCGGRSHGVSEEEMGSDSSSAAIEDPTYHNVSGLRNGSQEPTAYHNTSPLRDRQESSDVPSDIDGEYGVMPDPLAVSTLS